MYLQMSEKLSVPMHFLQTWDRDVQIQILAPSHLIFGVMFHSHTGFPSDIYLDVCSVE